MRDGASGVTVVRPANLRRAALVAWIPTVVLAGFTALLPSDAMVMLTILVAMMSFVVCFVALGGLLTRRLRVFRDGVQQVLVSSDAIEVRFGSDPPVTVAGADVEAVIWWRSMRFSREIMQLGIRTRSSGLLGLRTRPDGRIAGLWCVGWTALEGLSLNRALRAHGYRVRNEFGRDLER